jgi:glycerol-3-phosphate dehydrogenase (NAD(P)+)
VSLEQILHELGHVAEGVYSAETVLTRARSLGAEMPITAAVIAVLRGELAPRAAVNALMTREARAERAVQQRGCLRRLASPGNPAGS